MLTKGHRISIRQGPLSKALRYIREAIYIRAAKSMGPDRIGI